MSNLKTYFKKSVSVCKKSSAYIRAILVLAKALYHAMVGNGNYEVSFTKIGRKWYCNVPGFPKELFEHTLMVGGASNYLEYYSRGENEIVATIRIAKEWEDKFYCGVRLYKVSSTLTGVLSIKTQAEILVKNFGFVPLLYSYWANTRN